METQRLTWTWSGEAVELGLSSSGAGPTVLLLPALSSISTRGEMQPLQQRLSSRYRTVAIDWPGFGDRPRPAVDWKPEVYHAFLTFLFASVVPSPFAVIAAGHGATYVLAHAGVQPSSFQRLVLIAPTWRGPLPTMMGGQRPVFARICRMVDLPTLGPLLYKLNVNRPIVRMMATGHVYLEPGWLTSERLQQKLAVTRAAGARHASVRFVTGALDPVASRAQFLELARRATMPVLTVYGSQTPARSRAEMEALIALPGIRSACLPRGKLGLHEEFPEDVAFAIEPFLSQAAGSGATTR
jgi:pimeloyl-ACP methyl ester carboxylesterase